MDDLECLFVSRSRGNYSRRLIEESRSGSPGCGGSTIPVTIGHERGKTEEASRMSFRKARYVSEARSGSLLDSFGWARSETPGGDLEAVLIALCFFFFDGPRSAPASLQKPHTQTHTTHIGTSPTECRALDVLRGLSVPIARRAIPVDSTLCEMITRGAS